MLTYIYKTNEGEKKSDMTILKVLSCSLFIVAAVPFTDAQLYETRHYNIYFNLPDNQDVFYGEYNVSVYIPDDTQHIYFHTENLFINTTTVTNNTQISKENEGKDFPHRPNKYYYDNETYITTISFPYILSSGKYTLYMKFSGLLGENGGFRTFYMNQQNDRVSLAATHYGTRRLFPLLKNSMYASYNISIKHHANYTALSNMPMLEVNVDENNMQWTRFETTPVIPVHFIAASVVCLDFILDTSQSAKLWCRIDMVPHMRFAYTVIIKIAQFLDNLFLYIRKSPKTNHIAIPKFHDVSDEESIKSGFVLYREADITFNQETDDELRKIEIVQVISYKVMHEWFYNAIDTYKWEPWLSKGLTTFIGIYGADETFAHYRIQDFFVVQMQHDVLHWGTKDTWPLIIESGFISSFEIPRYIKASIMFRTFQIIFTEKTLQSGMEYLQDHIHVSPTIFLNVLQFALDKSFGNRSYRIDRITNWAQLEYYPVINVERIYNTNLLNISVENFTTIWIPVNITTRTHYLFNKILPTLWLRPNNSSQLQTIDFINQSDWVLANLQQSGCYRVNYDAENWNRLSEYLNNNSYETIHVLDRAKIIDDTFHFLMTGQLNVTIFLNISHYLGRDTDYIAWYPMFKNLEYMSGFFAFPESVPIKNAIMEPLFWTLWNIKYPDFKLNITQESVFTKCLRQEAARWLCNLDQEYCLSGAKNELEWYLSNRTKFSPNKIWIGWKEWTFCNGLKIENDNIWMQVYDIYLKESDYSILKFLACSKNASIILQYMHLMANTTNVTAIDRISSFCTIVARHANNTPVLDFILHNLQNIKPKEISLFTALTIIINHVYSKEHIDQIKEYTKINLKDDLKFAINFNEYINDTVIKYLRKMNIEKIRYEIIMHEAIMCVNRKLELRWNQTRNHLHEYRYLIKDYDYILDSDYIFNEDLAD